MAKRDSYDFSYKIILVGNPEVGKTSFLARYTKGIFPKKHTPTIGVEYATKNIVIQESGDIVKVQIWDTAGSDKYQAITSAHYRKAVGALLFYDLTDEKSFNNTQKWLQEIETHVGEQIVIMLIGNKLDLIQEDESLRVVPLAKVQQLVHENSLLYEETSAKSGFNVTESFEKIVNEIYKKGIKQVQQNNIILKSDNNEQIKQEGEQNNSNCCV